MKISRFHEEAAAAITARREPPSHAWGHRSRAETADWFCRFVDRCQCAATLGMAESINRLSQAIDDAPQGVDPSMGMMALGIAAHVLLTISSDRGVIVDDHLVARRRVDLRTELRRLLNRLGSMPRVVPGSPDHDSLPVDRALDHIARSFAEPTCCLDDAARSASVSRWHLSHVLKERTGYGFVWHLRRRRVDAAQSMLLTSPLSIKEIAFATGYRGATQLCRDFRLLCGTSPATFRRRERATTQSATTVVDE